VSEPTFSSVSVVADTIVRTVELGVTITDAAIEDETTVVWCDLLTTGPGRCPGCGTVGTYRDRVERRLTDLPVAGHPMQLRVRMPRYRCLQRGCERVVFCHDTSRLARAGATTTRRCARFVLRRLIVDRVTVAAVARELGRCWDTINTIAIEATGELLAADPTRLEQVRVIGVDEHRWAHTRHAAGEAT
jgi:transposase